MKKIVFIIITLVNLCFTQDLIDGVAAIVGDKVILKSEVEQYAMFSAQQLQIDPVQNSRQYQQLLEQSLDAMIDEKVLLIQADIDTIEVRDRDVENSLNEQIQMMIRKAGSEELLEEVLGKSISKLKMEYRSKIKDRLTVQQLQNEKFATVTVSRREVQEFYNTYKDSIPEIPKSLDFNQILFEIKSGEEEEKKAYNLADSLRTLILNGEDFGTLAKQYSQDPGSAMNGGDLGFTKRTDLVKPFAEAAFNLKNKEVSKIVRSEFGYHIIKRINRQAEKVRVQHILIIPEMSSDNDERTRIRAEKILARIKNNEISFDSAAYKYSDDDESRINMGRIPRIPKSAIQNYDFIVQLEALEPGEISPVFKTDMGYHILRFNGEHDDTWPTLEKFAIEEKKGKLYQAYVNEIKKNVYIEKK